MPYTIFKFEIFYKADIFLNQAIEFSVLAIRI